MLMNKYFKIKQDIIQKCVINNNSYIGLNVTQKHQQKTLGILTSRG
jgi:hypothetical protein